MEKVAEGFKGEKAIVTPYNIRNLQRENNITKQFSSVILDTILMQKIILGKGKKGLTRMSLYIVRVVAVGLVIKVRSIS